MRWGSRARSRTASSSWTAARSSKTPRRRISSENRAPSALSSSFPRFCITDLPFRREHARPERQAPVRPVCPVGLYRAHIRIRLVALPEALPRRGGVRPVVRARRFHGRNGPRGVARELLERAIEEPARRLRLDRGCDRRGGADIPRVVPAVDAVFARSGPAGARFAGGGRDLQVFAVRSI